jgi:hypothetical protein
MSFTEEISNLLRQAHTTKNWDLILEVLQRLEDISFEDDVFDNDADEKNEELGTVEFVD